jgi:cytoskeletal protein CcmA (bactofilin family)
MNNWLDLSNNANKLKNSYFSGFIDISGGYLNIRNDGYINLFDSNDYPTFSINSEKIYIRDSSTNITTDISNDRLIYLKNVTSDLQLSISNLNQITSSFTTTTNLDASINNNLFVGKDTNIGGRLFVNSGPIVLGNVSYYNPSEEVVFDNESFYYVKMNDVTSYDQNINGNLTIRGKVSAHEGFIVSGDASIEGRLFVSEGPIILGNIVYLNPTEEVVFDNELFYYIRVNDGSDGSSNITNVKNNLSVTGIIYAENDLIISNRLFVLEDVSLNGNVSTGGDVSINSNLYVTGNIFMNGNKVYQTGPTGMTGATGATGPFGYTGFTGPTGQIGPIFSGNVTFINPIEKITFDTDSFYYMELNSGNNYDAVVNGNAVINNNFTVNGSCNLNGNQTSTSINSGSLTVNGGVGISGSLYVGETCFVGGTQITSDYRIKEDIKELDETYNIDNIHVVNYYNKNTKKKEIGVIAHELEENYPYLVNGEKDGNNLQSVNYIGIIGLLIKEIQILKEKLNK